MALEKWFWGNFLKVKNRGKAVYGKFYQIQNLGEITLGETSKSLKIQGKPARGNVEKKSPKSFLGEILGEMPISPKKNHWVPPLY